MSSSDAGASARARVLQGLRDGLAPLGVTDGGVRELDGRVTMFTLGPAGNTVMCVRLRRLDDAPVSSTLMLVAAMLQYCLKSELAPCALVLAEVSGRLDHAGRADLKLVEDMFDRGAASHGLWRDLAAVSRSMECGCAHLAAVRRAGAELHVLSPPGRVDRDALPGLAAVLATTAFPTGDERVRPSGSTARALVAGSVSKPPLGRGRLHHPERRPD
jgi:hypothetical protein